MIATLDPRVLSAISDLELVARVTVDGTVAGLHRSPFHGYSAEFSQYRPYRAGDDLKYVDWKLFARTDRFYTKQFRETTNLLALIALDASGSMGYAGANGVTKFDYARLLGAALSHLMAGQGDGIGLVVYDDAVRQFIPSRTGRSHLRSLLVALSKVEPAGRTAAAAALRRAPNCSNGVASSCCSRISMTMRRRWSGNFAARFEWGTRWRCSMCSRRKR